MTNRDVFGQASADKLKVTSLGDFYRDYQKLVSFGLSRMDSDPEFCDAVYKVMIPFYDFQHKLNQDLSVQNPLKEAQLNKLPLHDHIRGLKATLDAMEDVLDAECKMPAALENKIAGYVRLLPVAAAAPASLLHMAVA